MMVADWMTLENEAEVASPALILHWERVEENLRRMISMAGDPARLRPHIKTHKLPQIVARQIELGITKFKCATIAEAELAASSGAVDVLLATQQVGPNIGRLLQLIRSFPDTHFSTITDSIEPLQELSRSATAAGLKVDVLIDLDVGQGRTGISTDVAAALYRELAVLPGIRAGGLHAYDGHLHQKDLDERTVTCHAAYAPVERLKNELISAGFCVPRLVVGGTPTFPIHMQRVDVECSPGTCALWDAGYGANLPDLDFLPAATLLARVISRPKHNRLCLDLGHKAVASEMPHPRLVLPALPLAKVVIHNEEHLVLETEDAQNFPVGSILHGIPWHICPTVALHARVHVAKSGRVTELWPVVGRTRFISI
jgi:D-serine deaminase-like pyridoxal phosphate-dependent protein